MRYVARTLEGQVATAARRFPAVVLTGLRRTGKTMLLRRLFSKARYVLLEDPNMVARLRADPHGLLDSLATPAILDEVQNVPEVFAHLRARIGPHRFLVMRRLDRARRLMSAGLPRAEAAIAADSADQAHRTRHFSAADGLPSGRFVSLARSAPRE